MPTKDELIEARANEKKYSLNQLLEATNSARTAAEEALEIEKRLNENWARRIEYVYTVACPNCRRLLDGKDPTGE